jgi:hypothetical protein
LKNLSSKPIAQAPLKGCALQALSAAHSAIDSPPDSRI